MPIYSPQVFEVIINYIIIIILFISPSTIIIQPLKNVFINNNVKLNKKYIFISIQSINIYIYIDICVILLFIDINIM